MRGTEATALKEPVFLTCSLSPVIYYRAIQALYGFNS